MNTEMHNISQFIIQKEVLDLLVIFGSIDSENHHGA